jgi:hypothetical protein
MLEKIHVEEKMINIDEKYFDINIDIRWIVCDDVKCTRNLYRSQYNY